jgi:hypothetical protein
MVRRCIDAVGTLLPAVAIAYVAAAIWLQRWPGF